MSRTNIHRRQLAGEMRGFTLIELLVVIAIIAILAAILFPVFAQAKAAAKTTATLSNCKQLITGVLMYSGDNDDLNVQGRDYFNDYPEFYNYPTWLQLIYPYTKNTSIFWDSTDGVDPTPQPMVLGGDDLHSSWGWWTWNGTIAMNENACVWWDESTNTNHVRVLSAQEFPSEQALMSVIRSAGYVATVGAPVYNADSLFPRYPVADATYNNDHLSLASAKHNHQIISAFADGHAGRTPEKKVMTWTVDYWTWYKNNDWKAPTRFQGAWWDATH